MNFGSMQILAANYFDIHRADEADIGGQSPSGASFLIVVGIVMAGSLSLWIKEGAKKSEFWMYLIFGFLFGCVFGPVAWLLFD